MEQQITEEQLQGIAGQLSCPQGAQGIETGNMMHESNIGMTTAAIESLQITDGNYILELGHGNCGHLEKIFGQAASLRYAGLEISETMHTEARSKNEERVFGQQAAFQLYDGHIIPFAAGTFDKIMTVNTVYFWQDPVALLQEICRVLKPGGFFTLAFAQKEFMQQLPFVKYRFRLYDTAGITELISQTDFQLVEVVEKTEQVKSMSGDTIQRNFSVAKMKKPL